VKLIPVVLLTPDHSTVAVLITESNANVDPSVCAARRPRPAQRIANEASAGSLGPFASALAKVW
jgi:hypothetical protein